MKKSAESKFQHVKVLAFLLILVLFGFNSTAINPKVSNFQINLSEKVGQNANDDVQPEMVISGNKIHVVWFEQGSPIIKLYYCRSIDLGKTWETPKLIREFNSTRYLSGYPNCRKLAVDGENVHIAIGDMIGNSANVFYYRSTNGGNSFEPAKVLISKGEKDGWYLGTFHESQIKAANGKVAIVYLASEHLNGLSVLTSINNGDSFTDKLITTDSNYLTDFWFDGTQMIVVSNYINPYAVADGKVNVSISNDNAATFKTNNISASYGPRCWNEHDTHYSSKVAKSGNTIHVVLESYDGYTSTPLYARSTDNGQTFEKAFDPNLGVTGNIRSGQPTIAAQNGHVYVAYLSYGGTKLYLAKSDNNGTTFSPAKSILPTNEAYINTTWFPSIVIDPNDKSGSTVYITGNVMYSTKSTDGGKTFNGSAFCGPFLTPLYSYMSNMAIDQNGVKHWIAEAQIRAGGTDKDIFYAKSITQPAPGVTNKALSININSNKLELVIVPSSPSISFDSAMTGEAWVKVLPGSELWMNVFGKVNGDDTWPTPSSGYQMTFDRVNGKRCLNSSIQTDKGQFINWSPGYIDDTLWHHCAFTYDANAGLNNFKSYFDGLLVFEQTVTGRIIPGDGLLMIGSRAQYNQTANYQVDDIRLWSRALTQEEILDNQLKTLTGKEDSLKLFLNFDDTFKDISGNGNDAIPLYQGNLVKSNFNPPIPGFDLYTDMSKVTLTNKTENGTSYLWDFGDKTTSLQENPAYNYPKPGEYKIALIAANANSKTSIIKTSTIAGLDRIEPTSAGNGGLVSISVYGGGLTVDGTTVSLRKTGESDIIGKKPVLSSSGKLIAFFNLNGKKIGNWDFVLTKGGVEKVLKEAFTIVKAELPQPWINVSGRSAVLLNMWQTYTINYGNSGNIDGLGVPLTIVISDIKDIDVELIDFSIQYTNYTKNNFQELIQARILNYDIAENYFGDGLDARFYEMVIPILPANSSKSIHIRIKSPGNFFIESWMNKPLFDTEQATSKSVLATSDDWPDEKTKLNACIAASAMSTATSIAADLVGTVLPIGCAYDLLTLVWNPWDAVKPERVETETGFDKTLSVASAVGGCVDDLIPPVKLLMLGFKIGQSMYDGYKKNEECHLNFDPLYKNRLGVKALSSWDPNEMIGPAGFGDEHWIQKNKVIPYTVLFENKSTATAPAHIVNVSDTLDLTTFNLKEFGFGAFGFGDTILSPNGSKLKKFAMDVDLRPAKNLITRVSGNLDTITGVVKWEFLSLNPTMMELEEDPMIGFLPPNNADHAGEGFVSFSVGVKEDLGTNDQLKNKASIVFDANKPIITNEYINTFDLDKPQSQVFPLDETTGNHFTLSWNGSDVGSGISSYSIFYLENDTALYSWRNNIKEKSVEFEGNVGSKYKFYSIATDNVSLMEDDPSGYDASTHVTVNVKEFEMKKEKLQVFPNPVKDQLTVTLQNAPCGMYVIELVSVTGQVCYSEIHDDYSMSNGVQINLKGYQSGQYTVRMIYGNKSVIRKILIAE